MTQFIMGLEPPEGGLHCDRCNTDLVRPDRSWGYYQNEKGEKLCGDCYQKDFLAELDAKDTAKSSRVEQFRKTIKLEEIPLRVVDYCTQSNPKVRDDVLEGCETRIEKIPISRLPDYGISCGVEGNRPFKPVAIAFLKKNSPADYVVAEINEDGDTIQNLAVRWKGSKNEMNKNSEAFADIVNSNGGSLRPEQIFDEEWDCYESE
jgi:hypothetical protein